MSWLGLMAAIVVAQGPSAPLSAPTAPPAPAAQPAPTPPAPPQAAPGDEDGPPASNAQSGVGESQIRSNYQSAEATRGPLDGRWRLTQDGGPVLYTFQFSDSGGAPDPRATTPMSPQVEGAWRDMRAPDGLNASGLFETVRHDGGRLVIVFHQGDPTPDQTLTLDPAGAAWTGDLVIGAAHTKVVMTREQ